MTDSSRDDRLLEQRRYDARASNAAELVGIDSVPEELRAPYHAYVQALRKHVSAGTCVLEIGAGTGEFTREIALCGARLCASDISVQSLLALRRRYEGWTDISVIAADMEKLPFPDVSFDAVTGAGSLSYGNSERVLSEIYRVLRPGGVFVCIDSLNNNPIYRFNRWIHFLRGDRSRSTLLRMPKLRSISSYVDKFGSASVEYFGAISWLTPILKRLFGARIAADMSDQFDRLVGVKGSAFKFVMTAIKR